MKQHVTGAEAAKLVDKYGLRLAVAYLLAVSKSSTVTVNR